MDLREYFSCILNFVLLTEILNIIPIQMQRTGIKPDVISYALLVSAYGKARREEEALAVFEEMLDAGVRCLFSFL